MSSQAPCTASGCCKGRDQLNQLARRSVQEGVLYPPSRSPEISEGAALRQCYSTTSRHSGTMNGRTIDQNGLQTIRNGS